jgi:isochorismate synthase
MKVSSQSMPYPTLENQSFEVKSVVAAALENDLSLALWRLPYATEHHLMLGTAQPLSLDQDPLEDLPAGFLFAPYEKTADSLFIKAALSWNIQASEGPSSPPSFEDMGALEPFFESLKKGTGRKNYYTIPREKCPAERAEFEAMVEKAIAEIHQGHFQKVVPSRQKWIPLPGNFDALALFDALTAKYPRAFTSLVSIPQAGTWISATPELLLSMEGRHWFRTVSLAGTQAYRPEIPLTKVAWTQKEIEEQALVSRYIINCFKKIRLREFEEVGPKTVVAANLIHLKTEFLVDMEATNFPQLGSVMLRLLHPTSAVCGMPIEPAQAFLQEEEHHDRTFYSGFLGPVNYQDSTHLFVHLRCMQLQESEAILYAGAGVTADSDAAQEWMETEMKCNTLLQVIQQLFP